MTRAVLLAVVAVLLAGCGSSVRPTSSGPRPFHPVPPKPTAYRFSAASNRIAAEENVRKLIHIVVVPPGALRVAKVPQSAPAWFRNQAKGFKQAGTSTTHRIWIVRMPLKAVVRYIRSHARPRPRPEARYRTGGDRIGSRPSSSYEFPPIPGRSWSRYLNVEMTKLPDGTTAVLAQAGDEWNVTPPRAALIPKGVKQIQIVSRYGKQPPNVDFGNSNAYDVASIVALTNGLGVVPHHLFCALFSAYGPIVSITFRAADGRRIARARVADAGGSGASGPCNPLELTVGKRTTALIGADLLLRIQPMLGVDLAPPLPRDVVRCLRSSGWSVNHVADRMLARHAGETWRVTFNLLGQVATDKTAPPTLRRCLRSGPRYVVRG